MKNLTSLLYKVPLASVVGCFVAVGLMQNDPWLKKRIEAQMKATVSDIVGEPFHVHVDQIDLLRGELILKDVSSTSSHHAWTFSCPTVAMHVSWLSWFKGHGIDTKVTMKDPTLYTKYARGTFAAEEPFYALVNAPFTVPLSIVGCKTEGSSVTIDSIYGEVSAHCATRTHIEPRGAVTTMQCYDGHVLQGKQLFAQHLSGKCLLEFPAAGTAPTVSMKVSCTRPEGRANLVDVPYHLYYRSAHGVGSCSSRAEDGSCAFQVEDLIETPQGLVGQISLSGDLGELASFVTDDTRMRGASGTGTFAGAVTLTDDGYRYSGAAALDQVYCNGVMMRSAHLQLVGDQDTVTATVADAETAGLELKGSVSARFVPGEVTASLSFSEPYVGIPGCSLDKGRTSLSYKDEQLKAQFKALGTFFGKTTMKVRGSMSTDFHTAKVRGTVGGNRVDLALNVAPFEVTHLTIKDQLHQKRLGLHQYRSQADAGLEGNVDGELGKLLFQMITGHQLTGSGDVHVKTSALEDGTRIQVETRDASLKIPGSYTIIQDAIGSIDVRPGDRTLEMRDVRMNLHKGSAWSSRALFTFADDGSCVSGHVPMQCTGLLLSKQKELFGTISGAVTASYADQRWRCSGLMTIENAQLRSNLLSTKVQRDLMNATSMASSAQDVDLDVRIQTRTPLKVETSFLTAAAHFDMKLTGSTAQPVAEGVIELTRGTFDFPYKPLFLTHGTLTIGPHQPDGPTIDLTAKNKIRSYNVTMRVKGTLQQPQVTFESSPQLPEENIITLLLAGSDQGSLTAAVPRVLMEQIEDVIFGSEEKLSAAQQFLKSILTPLKNVRIEPKGSDKEELQAVVEVDINDRLRAKAQNNVTFSDDTHLELEYVVSDDVTVKAVRDQEGSIGGEVEMRWKF